MSGREQLALAGGIMIDMIATTGRTMRGSAGSIEIAERIDCTGRTGAVAAIASGACGAFIGSGEVGDVPRR